MKTKLLLTKMLLAVAGLCAGSMSTWADENVGASDFSKGYLADNSSVITLADGGSIHYTFTHTRNTTKNYFTWILYAGVTGETVTWANGVIIVRGDNWEDKDNKNSNCTTNFNWGEWDVTTESNPAFCTEMNGATVDMAVSYKDGKFTMLSNVTTDVATYYYNYTKTIDAAPASLDVCLSMNAAYLTITRSQYYAPATYNILNATLSHTASTSCGANTSEVTFTHNAAEEKYNVDHGSNTYQGYAFAEFDISGIPSGNTVTEATLSWAAQNVSNGGARNNSIYYLNSGQSLDYATLTTTPSLERRGSARTFIETVEWAKGTQISTPIEVETNVLDAVRTLQTNGTVIFQWTNNAGGAKLQGKAASKAPSLSITYTNASSASYTVNYLNRSGTALKAATVHSDIPVGTVVTASDAEKASFVGDDVKYVYAYSSVCVVDGSDTNVLNVYFDTYAKYNYTVSSSLGTEIASGFVYADAPTITVPYPKYELSGTDLYMATKNSNSDYWRKTYTITADNQEETIIYTKSLENVASYMEGEDITSLTRTERTDYSFHLRCSNAAAGYPANTTANKIITLPAGAYRMYVSVWGNATHSFTFKKGDEELLVVNCNGTVLDKDIPFTLTASTDITVTASYNASNRGIDYVIFQNVASVSKTITAAGWATYCSPYALDLEHATGLTDAYIVTGGDGSVLAKTSVKGGTVPANTGLLLKGDAGIATIPVVANSSTDVFANKLVGKTESYVLAANGGYVLMNDATNGLGFYKNNKAFTVGANTAYLPAGFDGTGAPVFYLFDAIGGTTGIEAVNGSEFTANGEYYNLAGQRVAQPTKGLYIVNGKKVVVK